MTFLGTLAQLTNPERSTFAGQGLLGLPLALSFHCCQCRRFSVSQQGFGLDRIVPHLPCSNNYIMKTSGILETCFMQVRWVDASRLDISFSKCKMQDMQTDSATWNGPFEKCTAVYRSCHGILGTLDFCSVH